MQVLYTSAELKRSISDLLSNPEPGDRRVVMVAYVGGRAQAFLPDPQNLEIVCWLQPGATDPLTLARLRKRRAKLFKSDRLHMKVYWSKRKGCVICSANASGSALGSTSQKEAGVLLAPGELNIERLWSYAQPTEIGQADIRRLASNTKRLKPRQTPRGQRGAPDFLEWRGLRIDDWKLVWWEEDAEFAKASIATAKTRYGVAKPHGLLNLRKGQLAAHDWALTFRLPNVTNVEWFYTDFIEKIDKADKDAFDPDNPYQAVQANPSKDCSRPPFRIDQKFKKALKKAVAEYGPEKIESRKSLKLSEDFIDLIAQNLK